MPPTRSRTRIATRRPTQSRPAADAGHRRHPRSFEELGVLLARHADGRPVSAEDIASLDRNDTAPFAAQCRERGLVLAADEVFTLLAHWITDRDLPRASTCPSWSRACPKARARWPTRRAVRAGLGAPRRRAGAARGGQFFMIFPTIRTLERLAAYDHVDSVLAACAAKAPLWTSCPRAGLLQGRGSALHGARVALRRAGAGVPRRPDLHHLDWQTDQPVPLLKNVMRLTAPNPGVMTGPGTNSYIVGDATRATS
jgi:recombination protein RecT